MNKLLSDLIAVPSITPKDNGAQKILADSLTKLGFTCEFFNKNKVTNLYARLGTKEPVLLFAGHTDVVCPGPIEHWSTPPFALSEQGDKLVGRGVADMKGAIVAMVNAITQLLLKKKPKGSVAFLITSGEEGDDFLDGTPYVMKQLQKRGENFDYCIVGEPSSKTVVGDTIKIGRRGSMTTKLTVNGIQGHVAYPQFAKNPIHMAAPIVAALSSIKLDKGNQYFPPSSLQITNMNGGIGQNNVIPKTLQVEFNIRYSTEQSFEQLKEKIRSLCAPLSAEGELKFTHNGPPFLTSNGTLIEACKKVLNKNNIPLVLSTDGGTSDGRFIAPLGIELVELGLINESIHKANEWIYKTDLSTLSHLYFELLSELLL